MAKEALIVIPGFDSKEVGYALNRTVDKLASEQSIATVNKVSTPENPAMQRLEVTYADTGEKKEIDVYEIYWGDIINQNYSDNLPVWKKVVFGLELIFFWLFSPVWKAAFKNKWMFIGIAFSGLVITFWYVSIVGVFISALDSTQVLDSIKMIFQEPLPEEEMRMGLSVEELPKLVSNLFTEIFLIAGIVIGLFPTLMNLILKVSGFSMKFIKSQLVRDDVKNRVQTQMNAINKDGSYERVTLFAHSLGVIPALEFLSDYNSNNNIEVRCITIGSAVSFMANKAKIFRDYAKKVINNDKVTEWADFFSKEDWLCSYESIGKPGDRFYSEEIKMDSSWLSRMSTKPHTEYFNHSKVIEKLIT